MIYLLKSPEAKKLDNGEYEHFFFSLKIGYTDDETTDMKKNRRLNMYFSHHRTIELVALIPNGTEEQEKKLHYKFKDLRWDNSNEWYIEDQSIIDYFKSATLEDLDNLAYNPDIRSGKFFKVRKELKTILGYICKNAEEVEEYLSNLTDKFGENIEVRSSIDYLKTQGLDFSKYEKIQYNLEHETFCEDEEINKLISDFLRGYQTLTRQGDRLKMLCELEMPEEVMELVLNQLSDADRIKSYYLNLGPGRIKQLGYNVTKMNKELGIVVFSQELLEEKNLF